MKLLILLSVLLICDAHITGNFFANYLFHTQDFCLIIECDNGPGLICCPTQEQVYCKCLPNGDPFCKCV